MGFSRPHWQKIEVDKEGRLCYNSANWIESACRRVSLQSVGSVSLGHGRCGIGAFYCFAPSIQSYAGGIYPKVIGMPAQFLCMEVFSMTKSSCFRDFAKYTSLNVMGMIGLSCYILADTFLFRWGLARTA